MEINKTIMTWVIRVMLIAVLNTLMVMGYAEQTPVKIEVEGHWNETERSISLIVPVSAYITSDLLFVQSSTLRSDITITIVKNGSIIYEKTVPAAQTANIGISVVDWEKGTYTLELRNQWGGYLYGDFAK
ncbi:DUF3244 domain-containing protein [Parabacteroides acidifaciens]|uniref:DUF3244 domain-containing protein n=1 Tax=Parabacteroides acidifaciens TaxID=2290935 RepID=A0A3D8HDJ8_9BACT|nr:DUF3244 domain-containing protein [Parabacteroides acidifaciens]MBC8602238.1 DUF3244 domain-containing protein [Parabacteroides acidifaciens]RDU49049.1 DUF3244 domain-containing protein [Parabacteroides acidifaciens]